MEVGEGVAGRGNGVWVTGRVAGRKKGVGLTSFDETEILQAVNASASEKHKINFFNIFTHLMLITTEFRSHRENIFLPRFREIIQLNIRMVML